MADRTNPPATLDREAWNALLATHQRRVLVALVALGATFDLARELAQRSWLRIYEQHTAGKLTRLELPGIVIRQATFFLADHRRQAARENVVADVDSEATSEEGTLEMARGHFSPGSESPERELLARETSRVVEAAVATCSPGQQRIFWAVYERPSMPHSEVAATVGISVQHLRQTLCEVRNRIRAALEAHHD